ncbi:MAG: nucleotidyltransferase family protein [Candidatus Daviesbacteria bacterium]|nr:nucleotidyltransferase family protein [Candidatus Daviesbacteria bacterium]
MKAVILAAGPGTRMGKDFPQIPKSMLPMAGKPLIQDQIEHLKRFGILDFYINLHFLPEKISNFLGDGSKFGVNITYSFENKILGTSGALNNFKYYLDQSFIVLYGDIFTRIDFNKFLKFHKNKKSRASLLIHKTDHPEDSDLIKINDKNQIKDIYTSPHTESVSHTNYSSAAIYILEPNVLQYLPDKFSDFMEDFFPILLKKGINLYGYLSNEYSKDIGTPERYKIVQKEIEKLTKK